MASVDPSYCKGVNKGEYYLQTQTNERYQVKPVKASMTRDNSCFQGLYVQVIELTTLEDGIEVLKPCEVGIRAVDANVFMDAKTYMNDETRKSALFSQISCANNTQMCKQNDVLVCWPPSPSPPPPQPSPSPSPPSPPECRGLGCVK